MIEYALRTSGIDWLTLTDVIRPGSNTVSELLTLWGILAKDCNAKDVWIGGYAGQEIRFSEGLLRYGCREREGNVDLMLVGTSTLGALLADIAPRDVNVTRIDFQVTIEFSAPNPNYARDLYDSVLSQYGGKSKIGSRSLSIVMSDTGQTLYIGKRSSRGKFFRIYDKSKDMGSEDRGRYWRFEVQIGRKYASSAWLEVWQGQGNLGVVKYVRDEFGKLLGDNIPLLGQPQQGLIVTTVSTQADNERRLRWLYRCVRPVLQGLISSGVDTWEALEMLGIDREKIGLEVVQDIDKYLTKWT